MDPLRAERVLTNSAQCPLHQGLNTRLLSAKCGRGGGRWCFKGQKSAEWARTITFVIIHEVKFHFQDNKF